MQKRDIFTQIFEDGYDTFMQWPEKYKLLEFRQKLIRPLQGEILEVGAGTGTNFALYQKGCKVTALEPSKAMLETAKTKATTLEVQADITIVQGAIGEDPWDDNHQAEKYDAIVCTLVLCTVPEPLKTLSYLAHWLKKGGKLVVLEHVAAEGFLANFSQNALTPLWKSVAGGCHLNRPTGKYLLEAGFIPSKSENFDIILPFIAGVYHLS